MEPLCGHADLVALITRLSANPAGAYGFFGPEHVGKRRLADLFARLLANHPEPLPLEGHPDIAVLDAAKNGDIEAVRAFLERMHRTSARGGRRVFLIDHAEGLNAAGYNALLKDVEEPKLGTVFLFVSSQPESLPATLRSRLVPLLVREVPAQVMHTWIADIAHASATTIDDAFGRPGLFLRQVAAPEWWQQLSRHAIRLIESYQHPQPGSLIAALDDWQRAMDASEHPDQEWRLLLLLIARRLTANNSVDIDVDGFGAAVLSAWRSLGGPVPTRIAFEWKRLQSEVDPIQYPEIIEGF